MSASNIGLSVVDALCIGWIVWILVHPLIKRNKDEKQKHD